MKPPLYRNYSVFRRKLKFQCFYLLCVHAIILSCRYGYIYKPQRNIIIKGENADEEKKLTCFISLTASAAILLCSMTGCGKENNSTAEPNPSLTIDENNSSVDSSSEENKTDTQSESFSMQIEDVFLMAGRGTYVLGTIESGTVRLNDWIEVSGNGKSMLGTIKEIEINREPANEAGPNQYVGLILENIERSEVEAGMYVATPSKEALDAYNALLEENAAVLHPPRDNKVIETRYVIDLRNDEYIETKCSLRFYNTSYTL